MLALCSLCCHLYNPSACQHCTSSSSLPSTSQPNITQRTLHSAQTSTPHPLASAIRDPARSALKRDIRALTTPPAWLAVALRCSVFALNGHHPGLPIFICARQIFAPPPLATVYATLLLALTQFARCWRSPPPLSGRPSPRPPYFEADLLHPQQH